MNAMKLISSDLIKIFNGNGRWSATEMNSEEVALISSGLPLLRIENEKFIADLADIVRKTLSTARGIDLILLTQGSFYMRKFDHCKDIYAKVHAQCMSQLNLNQLTQQEVAILTKLYTK